MTVILKFDMDSFIDSMEKVSDEDALQFGVLGQKWGVRRSRAQLASGKNPAADPDAIKAVETQAKISAAGSLNVVSSKDLQQLVDRVKLEQKYIDTTLAGSPTTKKGKSTLSKVFGVVGREFTMKASGKDGPLLMGFKFLKAVREKDVAEAVKQRDWAAALKENAARNAATARATKASAQKPKTSSNPFRATATSNGPGPAQRRTVYAERVYNVTTLNALGPGGNPLALPSRKKP